MNARPGGGIQGHFVCGDAGSDKAALGACCKEKFYLLTGGRVRVDEVDLNPNYEVECNHFVEK